MKMYILIPEDLPPGFAILAASHAALACYLEFESTPEVREWIAGPFNKVICRVGPKELERAETFADRTVLTESALDGRVVAVAFKPRQEWPKPFRFYRLWK